jgi:FkbM family methyltransferase
MEIASRIRETFFVKGVYRAPMDSIDIGKKIFNLRKLKFSASTLVRQITVGIFAENLNLESYSMKALRTYTKKLIRRLLPPKFLAKWRYFRLGYLESYAEESYAQEGEDMVLRRIFESQPTGFFIDIGAHHPRRFSNTYYLYKSGWSGINIDATPGSMRLFQHLRPRDINLEIAIASEPDTLTFYVFDEPALNTFDRVLAEDHSANSPFRLLNTATIQTRRLSAVLEDFLPLNTRIDFMSIDVEGFDFEVLKSNDWQRFRPAYLLTECLNMDIAAIDRSTMAAFLQTQNYTLFAKTVNTVFFRDELRDD